MRQSYKIIPVYTSDISGVCSALYELGGMVVMHDPSGCNSTYNTHDEIRWYDMDSLIYISGLAEIDAIMGNDPKFIQDIEEAANKLHPRFIALVSSPIPYINGTDFKAIANILETDTGIPTFVVKTNGMHDYTRGAGEALKCFAQRFVGQEKPDKIEKGSINLLGVTPLDFGPQSCVDKMKKRIESRGWKVLSTWAMGNSFEDIVRAPLAEVNLVVSAVGLLTAEYFYEKFGTPYVIGAPIDGYMDQIDKALREKVRISFLNDRINGKSKVSIVGEPVTMGSLAAAIEDRYKIPARVICPLEVDDVLLGKSDIKTRGEEEIEEVFSGSEIIIADPLYKAICPKGCEFYELPHFAFSGRNYLKKIEEGIVGV